MPNDKGINYSVIRIEEGYLIYWTQKALLHIFSSNEKWKELQSEYESNLIENGYIDRIKLDDIHRVLF